MDFQMTNTGERKICFAWLLKGNSCEMEGQSLQSDTFVIDENWIDQEKDEMTGKC